MAKVNFLKSGGIAALAAAIAILATPASAQDGRRGGWSGGERAAAAGRVQGGMQGRAMQVNERPAWRPSAPAAQPAPQPPVMRRAPEPQRPVVNTPAGGWQGRGTQGGQGWQGRGGQGREGQGWQGRGGQVDSTGVPQGRPHWRGNGGAVPPVTSVPPQGVRDDHRRDGVPNTSGTSNWRGNRDGRDGDHRWRDGDTNRRGSWRRNNGTQGWQGRDGHRDNHWRDGDNRRDHNWRDHNWRGHNGYRNGDNHRWNRDWRSDNRYNWRGHREHYGRIYRPGRYYAPYRNYYYQPISIGFTLDSLFYSNDYWLNDPGYYRLPPVDGPYRWVRYYDDVLLVDIYSGEVVDVLENFFW